MSSVVRRGAPIIAMRRWLPPACGALVAALALMALPASAGAFSKAIWGYAYVNGVNQFPIYHRLGVKIIELDLNWAEVAPLRPADQADPDDPAYQWPLSVQQVVTMASAYHMHVLLQVIGAPGWANGGHPWNWAPRPGAYARFTTAASREYPSVHLWMIWGEPNRPANFSPEKRVEPGRTLNAAQKVAPHNYARMLNAAYGSLKAVSARNTVIGGCTFTSGAIDTEQWIENLRLPNGRPPRMDMYAHNPFSWRTPKFSNVPSPHGQVQIADLKRLGGMIDHNLGHGIPIFISELTMPTKPDEEFNWYTSRAGQARWIRQTLRTARSWHRIRGLGWIHLYDDPPVSYGGLITASGVRKPGFYAFARG